MVQVASGARRERGSSSRRHARRQSGLYGDTCFAPIGFGGWGAVKSYANEEPAGSGL